MKVYWLYGIDVDAEGRQKGKQKGPLCFVLNKEYAEKLIGTLNLDGQMFVSYIPGEISDGKPYYKCFNDNRLELFYTDKTTHCSLIGDVFNYKTCKDCHRSTCYNPPRQLSMEDI